MVGPSAQSLCEVHIPKGVMARLVKEELIFSSLSSAGWLEPCRVRWVQRYVWSVPADASKQQWTVATGN